MHYVNAFEPEGEPCNAATATETLKERVPSHVQEQVEENFHGRSAQIRELAIPAATHEDLVHSEVRSH